MFENVLVGVDGRPAGRDAIALAARLRTPTRKLTLAHVPPGRALRAPSPPAREARARRVREAARAGASRGRGRGGAGQHGRRDARARPAPAGRRRRGPTCSWSAPPSRRRRPGDARRRHARRAERRSVRGRGRVRGYAEQPAPVAKSGSHTTARRRARRALAVARRAGRADGGERSTRSKSSRSAPTPTPGSCRPASERASR